MIAEMEPDIKLLNADQASAMQRSLFDALQASRKGRLLYAAIESGILVVCYLTKSGFIVRMRADHAGNKAKRYFRSWNCKNQKPENPL